MSDSDDTDLLLLIPPNFFIVPSDDELDVGTRDFERELVSDLIEQVNELESRVCAIENSDISVSETVLSKNDSYIGNSSEAVQNVSDDLKFYSLGIVSPVGSHGYGSETLTTLSRREYENHMAKETDEFYPLNSSQADESTVGSDYIALKMTDDSSRRYWSPSKRLDLPEVDRLLKEMETTQAEIENKLRMREMEFETNPLHKDSQKRVSKLGDDIGSVPDLGFGIRSLFVPSPNPSPIKNSGEKGGEQRPVVEEPCVKKNAVLLGSSRDDNDTTPPRWKTFLSHDYSSPSKGSNPQRSPEKRRQQPRPPRRRLNLTSDGLTAKSTLEHDIMFGATDKQPTGAGDSLKPKPSEQPKPLYPLGGSGERLLSLNDLWKEDGVAETALRLRQKLEEEKYRRTHLEQTIEVLQRKVLEEQEKVAVAVKVDEAKDRAIGQVTEAWRQMVDHWRKLEEQRHQVSQKLLIEKAASKKLQEDISKKIERWEKEVSQALDLAAGYKNKCEGLETELFSTQETLSTKVVELEESSRVGEVKLKRMEEERKELAGRLQMSQEEHEQERRLVSEARKDLAKAETALGQMEAELAVVKEQRDLLSTRLKEERGRNATLEQQKQAFQGALEEAIANQAKAEEEAKTAVGQLEGAKGELRAVYQAQLESVVREKLAEFQSQLDTAQAAMQAELQAQQRQAQDKAVQQQQALVNSHVAEMRRLESIHKEEVRAIEVKLNEAQRRCSRLESGKKDIAQKLHSVMENQWQQALTIITSELSMRQGEADEPTNLPAQQWSGEKQHRLNLPIGGGSGGGSEPPNSARHSDDTAPFNREGQLTYRLPPKQDQLINYIQMLLDRQPGHPVDSLTSSGILQDITTSDVIEDPNYEVPKWNDIINEN